MANMSGSIVQSDTVDCVLARRDPLTLMVRGPHNTGFAITYNAFLVTVRKINCNCFFLIPSDHGC